MLSTAQALLGLSRHLSAYLPGPDRAALGQLEFAGRVLEMGLNLRGSGLSSATRVLAIGASLGLSRRQVMGEIVPTLATLGWLEANYDVDRNLRFVTEAVPPLEEALASADLILEVARPEPVERAVLALLDATVRIPMTRPAAISIGEEVADAESAEHALDLLTALHLVATVTADDGRTVVYNPNIWAVDTALSEAALRAEDSAVAGALGGLLEEVGASQGLPEAHVTAAPQEWIDWAVEKGLLLRSLVRSSDGREQSFLFSPHMGRSAFETALGSDPSGHVRQLIGSMMFAHNFARTRLYSPTAFLRRLISDGEAGDASAIGSDYPMLEVAGIVRVEPAAKYYKLVLLQSDVAEEALSYLGSTADVANSELTGLRDQRRYVQPEQERARLSVELARSAKTTDAHTARLVAALREVVRANGT